MCLHYPHVDLTDLYKYFNYIHFSNYYIQHCIFPSSSINEEFYTLNLLHSYYIFDIFKSIIINCKFDLMIYLLNSIKNLLDANTFNYFLNSLVAQIIFKSNHNTYDLIFKKILDLKNFFKF